MRKVHSYKTDVVIFIKSWFER